MSIVDENFKTGTTEKQTAARFYDHKLSIACRLTSLLEQTQHYPTNKISAFDACASVHMFPCSWSRFVPHWL